MTGSHNTARRLYLVGPDRGDPSDLKILNETELFVQRAGVGRHQIIIGGSSWCAQYGLPEMRTKPILQVAIENKPRDFLGLGHRFLSNRAKELLCSVAPGDFEFVECDTSVGRGEASTPYWIYAPTKIYDWAGDEGSVIDWYRDRGGLGQENNPLMAMINVLNLSQLPPDIHAFRLARWSRSPILDGVLVDAIRKAKLTGLSFSPLQQPTAQEWRRLTSFQNFDYWYKVKKGEQVLSQD